MTSLALRRALVAPSRVANILESTTRPVLSLEIQRNRIGVALAWTPYKIRDVERLPDLTFEGRQIPKSVITQLAMTVQDYDVGGFVVRWPSQKESGKIGGPCGRVLYTLEELATQGDIFSQRRPLCMWDPDSNTSEKYQEDKWGRSAHFSHVSSRTIHEASKEQYGFDETIQATAVWNDFWKTHWPVEYKKCHTRGKKPRRANTLVADWQSAPAYLAAKFAMRNNIASSRPTLASA
eukprot:Nitzschia sp. Nitz4//scaffold37_size175936//41985//42692//NITZ4_002034-RA/size175936-processed-gene-0.179-mRNA-1//1//CDS//3329549752//1287//frame0